jgi:hypothetical protein
MARPSTGGEMGGKLSSAASAPPMMTSILCRVPKVRQNTVAGQRRRPIQDPDPSASGGTRSETGPRLRDRSRDAVQCAKRFTGPTGIARRNGQRGQVFVRLPILRRSLRHLLASVGNVGITPMRAEGESNPAARTPPPALRSFPSAIVARPEYGIPIRAHDLALNCYPV